MNTLETAVTGFVLSNGGLNIVVDAHVSGYLENLINVRHGLETHCDQLISRQEDLSRMIVNRASTRYILRSRSLEAEMIDQGRYVTREPVLQSYHEFQASLSLARGSGGVMTATSKNSFVKNIEPEDVVIIEGMEDAIATVKSEMMAVEESILSCVPSDTDEVAAKLKFIVLLMLDGQEFETDYFTYLVGECADVLQSQSRINPPASCRVGANLPSAIKARSTVG